MCQKESVFLGVAVAFPVFHLNRFGNDIMWPGDKRMTCDNDITTRGVAHPTVMGLDPSFGFSTLEIQS